MKSKRIQSRAWAFFATRTRPHSPTILRNLLPKRETVSRRSTHLGTLIVSTFIYRHHALLLQLRVPAWTLLTVSQARIQDWSSGGGGPTHFGPISGGGAALAGPKSQGSPLVNLYHFPFFPISGGGGRAPVAPPLYTGLPSANKHKSIFSSPSIFSVVSFSGQSSSLHPGHQSPLRTHRLSHLALALLCLRGTRPPPTSCASPQNGTMPGYLQSVLAQACPAFPSSIHQSSLPCLS